MDRFTQELYSTSRPAHFASEEDMYEWEANNQPEPEPEPEEIEEPEPVPAVMLSACCGAEFKYQPYSHGIDPETGYHDDGELCVCLGCGNETEPELRAELVRKPVERAQGELFNQGVA